MHALNANGVDDGHADSTQHSRRGAPCSAHACGQAGPQHGGEVRAILESAVSPAGRVKLGSLLADLGQQARLSDEEFAVFETVRDVTPARPLSFE